jgi:hypothetical protein
LRLIVLRARYTIDGDHDGLLGVESGGDNLFLPSAARTTVRLVSDYWYWLTLGLAALALPSFLRRSSPSFGDRLLVALVAASLIAIPLELYGYTRFHIPALPFQAIAAAITLVYGSDLLRRRADPRP